MANTNTRVRKKKGNTSKKNKVKLFPPSRIVEIVFYSLIMFVLGVLTGRGTAPISFNFSHKTDKALHLEIPAQFEPVKVKVDFYDEISSDKESEINKSIIKAEDKLPLKLPLYKGEKKQSELFSELLSEKNEDKSEKPEKFEKPVLRVEKSESVTQNKNKDFFTVQIAAMKNKDDADYLAKKIINQGFPAYSASGLSEDNVFWHRVRVGRFEDKKEAENMKKRLLEQLKLNGIVLIIK
ncbi:MAG: SPOR domain-containing protein [Desulforegulaceae bacterium]|jgi:hypothetical protein|nr:SPOR domain-containing protein [Desulforegulaceae bacterium]